MSEAKHTLDNLFALAKQQPPLLANQNVHDIIKNAPTKAFPGKQLVNFFQNHLNFWIMSTLVSSIIIGSVLWMNATKSAEKVINPPHSTPKQEYKLTSRKPVLASTINSFKESVPELKISKPDSLKSVSTFSLLNLTTPSFETKKTNNESEKIPSDYFVSGDEYEVKLTVKELMNLGFIASTNIFYYHNFSPDSITSQLEFSFNQDIINGNCRQSTSFGYLYYCSYKKPVTKNDFYPVYVTAKGIFNDVKIHIEDSTNLFFKTNRSISSIIMGDDYRIIQRNEQSITYDGSSIRLLKKDYSVYYSDKYGTPLKRTNTKYLGGKKFIFENDTLVPVTIVDAMPDTIFNCFTSQKYYYRFAKELVFWFKPTRDFYNALPERYREKTKKFYEQMKLYKRAMPENSNCVIYNTYRELYNSSSSNIKFIDLQPSDLSKLGIQLTDSALNYLNNYNSNGYTEIKIDTRNLNASIIEKPERKIRNRATNNNFQPIFLTIPQSSYIAGPFTTESTNVSAGSFLIQNLGRLVPIRVSKENFKKYGSYRNDYVFWFTPTEAFFDSLPPTIGSVVRNEYYSLLSKTDPAYLSKLKSDVSSNCEYFEECRVTYDGLTDFKVYPNPVTDNFTLEITLEKSTIGYVSLFDISGRPVSMLNAPALYNIGTHKIPLELKNIPSGIYILSIRDNKGNNKTQRIIKQ
jgi:hypothetical protein